MLFNTYQFVFVFAPLSIFIFYFFRWLGLDKIAFVSVILASFIFYGQWVGSENYLPYLVTSIALNYAVGCLILKTSDISQRVVLAIGVAGNLIFLGYFKYAGFLITQGRSLFHTNWDTPTIALPLAVSFYTFQQIAYLVDCRRGKVHDNDPIKYVFTVTFFPHLVAGPIVRMQEIVHQFGTVLTKKASVNIAIGLTLFIIGLGKKVIIADWFKDVSEPLFLQAHTAGHIDFASAWLAALSFTLQLYFDFSGYSDMAIGLARMFGFRLAVNFLSPYQSTNIAVFWRRWHITLSRFLRDYLYVPFGGNRKGNARTYVNLLATMALGGLWHGAAWTFVAWGAYHGLLLAVHRAWVQYGARSIIRAPFYQACRPLWVMLTFFFVVAGWVIFKSPDFPTALVIFKGMASPGTVTLDAILAHGRRVYVYVFLALMVCWIMPNTYQILYRVRPALFLREQIALIRQGVRHYAFHFNSIEAASLSIIAAFSIYEMRGAVSQFLYFMF